MCGIAGILTNDLVPRAWAQKQLSMMQKQIARRGPDDEGIWIKDHYATAHSRLAVTGGLSKNASQPIIFCGGRLVLCFNGEIYNYRDLKVIYGLKTAKMEFGDAEILSLLIEQKGLIEALKLCEGMFAVSLYDVVDGTLYLARDRFGEKPLYFGVSNSDGGKVVFGSTISSIFACTQIKKEVAGQSLGTFVLRGFCPEEQLPWRDIKAVQPGLIHTLKFSRGKLREERVPYWSLPKDSQSLDVRLDASEILTLRDRVVSSVRLASSSDEPVAIYLSGGIDSSVIAACCGRKLIKTAFLIDFGEPNAETRRAKLVADVLGIKLETVKFDRWLFEYFFGLMNEAFDLPQGDASAVVNLVLASYATEAGFKVCLSGEGGDEFFGGYARYQAYQALSEKTILMRSLQYLRPFLGSIFESRSLIKSFGEQRLGQIQKIFEVSGSVSKRELSKYYQVVASLIGYREIFSEEFLLDEFNTNGIGLGANVGEDIVLMQMADIGLFLKSNLCAKSDRASMYFGLEVRQPLLNHRIFEKAIRLPDHQKIVGNQTKTFLREMLAEMLPKINFGVEKKGLNVPLFDVMSNSERLTKINEFIIQDPFNFFSMELKKKYANKKSKNDFSAANLQMLWRVYSLACWSERNELW